MSLGWFDCTEPSITTSLEGKQSVQGAYALVRVHRTSSNLLEPHYFRESKVCRVLSHKFGVVQAMLWLLEKKCRKWLQRCGTAVYDKEGWQKHSIEIEIVILKH